MARSLLATESGVRSAQQQEHPPSSFSTSPRCYLNSGMIFICLTLIPGLCIHLLFTLRRCTFRKKQAMCFDGQSVYAQSNNTSTSNSRAKHASKLSRDIKAMPNSNTMQFAGANHSYLTSNEEKSQARVTVGRLLRRNSSREVHPDFGTLKPQVPAFRLQAEGPAQNLMPSQNISTAPAPGLATLDCRQLEVERFEANMLEELDHSNLNGPGPSAIVEREVPVRSHGFQIIAENGSAFGFLVGITGASIKCEGGMLSSPPSNSIEAHGASAILVDAHNYDAASTQQRSPLHDCSNPPKVFRTAPPKSVKKPLPSAHKALNRRASGSITYLKVAVLVWVVFAALFAVYVWPYCSIRVDGTKGASDSSGSSIRSGSPGLDWGYVSIACMCLSLLPVMRASWVSFLGKSFEEGLDYHKWIGRLTCIAAWMHAIYYFVDWSGKGLAFWGAKLHEPKFIYATASLACLTLITLSSLACIRRAKYELFRRTHHIFLIGSLALVGLHAPLAFRAVIAAACLYGFELLSRYLPIACRAVMVDDIKLLPGQIIRIRFKKAGLRQPFKAGQYVILNFPQLGGEWHPFTLTSAPSWSFLEVHIKASGNFTHRLVEEVIAQTQTQSMALSPTHVRIDGPYGRCKFEFTSYLNLVLVGAGIGITPMISLLRHIYTIDEASSASLDSDLNSKQEDAIEPPCPHLRKCFFMWTVSSPEHLAWFWDVIVQADMMSASRPWLPELHIFINITGAWHSSDSTSLGDLATGYTSSLPKHIIFNSGRPFTKEGKLLQVVKSKSSASEKGAKRIGLIACGPRKFTDAVWDRSISISEPSAFFDCHREVFS